MYVSTQVWRDLTDGHLYTEGEKFPFDGREIAPERLAELESGRNRAGLRLIRALDARDEPEEARDQGAPYGAENGLKTEAPKKPRRAKTRK